MVQACAVGLFLFMIHDHLHGDGGTEGRGKKRVVPLLNNPMKGEKESSNTLRNHLTWWPCPVGHYPSLLQTWAFPFPEHSEQSMSHLCAVNIILCSNSARGRGSGVGGTRALTERCSLPSNVQEDDALIVSVCVYLFLNGIRYTQNHLYKLYVKKYNHIMNTLMYLPHRAKG